MIVLKNLFDFFSSIEVLIVLASPFVASYFSSKLPTKWIRYVVTLFGSLLLIVLIFVFAFDVFNVSGFEVLGDFLFLYFFAFPYSILASLLITFLKEKHRTK